MMEMDFPLPILSETAFAVAREFYPIWPLA